MKNFYDVVIIGAGPVGIFTEVEIYNKKPELSVLTVDKGRSKKHSSDIRLRGLNDTEDDDLT